MKKFKSRLKSQNACCHSVQNLLSSNLLSQNIKNTRNSNFGCSLNKEGIWSVKLREKNRLRTSESVVLGSGENCIMRSWMIYTPHKILFAWSSQERWDGQGLCHVWGRGHVQTGFLWGNLRERDQLEDIRVDGYVILKLILKKWDGSAWTVWIWFRVVAGDRWQVTDDRWHALMKAEINSWVP